MPTNWYWIASGVLIVGLGVFHSVLGERYIVRRLLRRPDLPKLFGDDSFTKVTIRYAWHITTILCAMAGALLFVGAIQTGPTWTTVGWILAGTFALTGMWGLLATRARHLSWIVLLLASAFAGIGSL